jgi:uncharacterized protein YbjT (DUF2867 family)
MQATRKIAVAGATGRVGRPLVEILQAAGHEVVAIARSNGVDLVTGDGLAAALEGVECVIDASTGSSPDEKVASDFFAAAARNLQTVGERAGVRRLIAVSIIGIDRFTGGYSAAKLVHERELLAGPVPAFILRAAQFHEFVEQMMAWGTQGDVVHLPRMRTQLVAARAVAEALAEMAFAAAPAGRRAPFPEIAGPREESLVEVAKLVIARRGESLRVEAVANPADPDAHLYEEGALLPGRHAMLAGPTFAEWLDTTGPRGPAARR